MSVSVPSSGWGSPGSEYASLDDLTVRRTIHLTHSAHVDRLDDLVTDALAPDGTRALLDVGCGTGDFLAHVRRRAGSPALFAVDTSPAAIAEAAKIDGVTAALADAQSLPFSDGAFDRVVARHMLYHVPDPALAIAEMQRVLEAGGRAVVVVNHPYNLPRIREFAEMAAERTLSRWSVNESTSAPPVHSDNLETLIRTSFDEVQMRSIDNALVFDRPEPVIAYGIASRNAYGIHGSREELEQWQRSFRGLVLGWFERSAASWRDPKGYAIATAIRR